MIKQEEIRAGVDAVLRHYLESCCSAVIGSRCHQKPPRCCENGLKCPEIERLLPGFKKDLTAKGVVITVERELPIEQIIQSLQADIADRNGLKQEWQLIDDEVMFELKAAWANIISNKLAGYEAVKPLVAKISITKDESELPPEPPFRFPPDYVEEKAK